jgi:hypothetical protein
LQGYGCRKCANESNTHSTGDFIIDAKNIFDNKYNYSCVNYKSAITKVEIICVNHGKFYQTPHDHLSGYGCPKCKSENISLKLSSTTDSFVKQANVVHNHKYDYSCSVYKNNYTKINIICPLHGIFCQTPSNHLSNHGCPKCVSSISNSEIEWLDALDVPEEFRHQSIRINNKIYKVDAYNPDTNTVYEFYGDYWHGNPARFPNNEINMVSKKTYGELYEATINRAHIIKSAGYNLIFTWEHDFKRKSEIIDKKTTIYEIDDI